VASSAPSLDLAGLRSEFEACFGRAAELAVRAPGRVNLIGEHTDYNEGLVLPCAIDRETRVLAARAARKAGGVARPGRFRVVARDLGEHAEFEARALGRGRGWIDYVQGVVFALRERGHDVPGMDLLVASSVPRGSGLSSSAALEVAVATAIDRAVGLGLDGEARARVAHRAETAFVGVACGLMDQLASALGRADHALRIDCRSLETRAVPLPVERLRLLIADSGVHRELAGAAYNQRRRECEKALEQAKDASVAPRSARALRDLAPDSLDELERALEPVLFRRARHVIRENQRVDEVCEALQRGDLHRAGGLLGEGQRSLRDDFEVSVPELDALCEVASTQPGVYGSRLTGAGFGGCTVHLVAPDVADRVAAALADGFEARFGSRPTTLVVEPSDGASVLPSD
jgi:galactokinase